MTNREIANNQFIPTGMKVFLLFVPHIFKEAASWLVILGIAGVFLGFSLPTNNFSPIILLLITFQSALIFKVIHLFTLPVNSLDPDVCHNTSQNIISAFGLFLNNVIIFIIYWFAF